jgi:hypothetical protein
MANLQSADDLIVSRENHALSQLTGVPQAEVVPQHLEEPESPTVEETSREQDINSKINAEKEVRANPKVEEKLESSTPEVESSSTKAEADEYGNPVVKEKLYTEDEVNRMMRERLARGKVAREEAPAMVQPPVQQQGQSDDDWQKELKEFVKGTYHEIHQEEQARQVHHRETQLQANFEAKFTAGVAKYNDFESIVGSQPITAHMMLATRTMENPAAFIYAAAKMQPKELERISKIQDPLAQVSEMARLDERMKKATKVHSSAPPPITKTASDVPTTRHANGRTSSIDHMIQSDALARRRR